MLERKYAGFWIRFLAHLIDNAALSAVSIALCMIALGITYKIQASLVHSVLPFSDAFNPLFLQIILYVAYIILAIPYYIASTYYYGGSLGKIALKLAVLDDKTGGPVSGKQSLLRCLGYAASWPLMIGYLMAAFQGRKKALHDLIAGTVVVIRPSKPQAQAAPETMGAGLPQ